MRLSSRRIANAAHVPRKFSFGRASATQPDPSTVTSIDTHGPEVSPSSPGCLTVLVTGGSQSRIRSTQSVAATTASSTAPPPITTITMRPGCGPMYRANRPSLPWMGNPGSGGSQCMTAGSSYSWYQSGNVASRSPGCARRCWSTPPSR